MYAGDEIHGDEVTSGPVPGDGGRTCQVCTTCGVACAQPRCPGSGLLGTPVERTVGR
jgi:hypothetical protein